MLRAALLACLLLVALAPAALAQSGGGGAFGPLPPATPVETPTPEPEDTVDDGKVSRTTLLLVGAGVLIVFGGLGIAITRDARRSLSEDDRAALERDPSAEPVSRKKAKQAKARARQRTKAQRKARRHNRPR